MTPTLPWPSFGDALNLPDNSANAWTVTDQGRGTLTVTDVQTAGDRFELFDNGVPMGPAPSPFGPTPQNPGQAAVGDLTSLPCDGCEEQGAFRTLTITSVTPTTVLERSPCTTA